MSAFSLVIICLLAGMLTARIQHPQGLNTSLNWWLLYIALPALVLDQIPRLAWHPGMWFPPLAMWLVFLGAWLLLAMLGRWQGWSRQQTGALILTCGLGNTAFVGYPLVEALRGSEGLGIAVIADQLGSFLVVSSLGVLVAGIYSGQRPNARHLLRRVVFFPAFVALLAALLLRPLGGLPLALADVAARLGSTLTPLALFSVGMQLRLRLPRNELSAMCWGLSWKLMLAPAVIWLCASQLNITGDAADVAILQSAMGPMVTGGILAQQYGLASTLASRILGIGVLLSLVSVPLIDMLLRL